MDVIDLGDNRRRGARQKVEQTEALTVSIPEAARMLGISRNLAYLGAARGEIPTVRIGHRLLVPKAALKRLLAEAA